MECPVQIDKSEIQDEYFNREVVSEEKKSGILLVISSKTKVI